MKLVDERIVKKTNELGARMLLLMLALQAIVLAVKIALGGAAYCILDGVALVVGLGAAALHMTIKGVWKAQDEALREIRAAGLARAFMAMLMTLIVGEFLLIMIDTEHTGWYAPSIIVWAIPALIYTALAVKMGLFQWGGKSAEANGKGKLAKSTALGALFFGLVMGGPDCIREGAFDPLGLVKVVGMGAMWGLLFYALFSLMLKLGGKQADKAVEKAEKESSYEE